MDTLKALVAKKRKATEEEFGGKKFVKRSDIEELRLRKLREEEQQELAVKEKRRKVQEDQDREKAAATKEKDAKKQLQQQEDEGMREVLSAAEVVRRLRLLGQPAMLFGENEFDRMKRLRQAEEEVQLEDEHAGGQQANTLLQLQRRDKGKAKGKAAGAGREAQAAKEEEEEPENETLAAFKRAAEAVRGAQEEERMCVDDKVHKYVKRWCEEWQEDMEAMPEDYFRTAAGNVAMTTYKQTTNFLQPMLRQLRNRTLLPDLTQGMWTMVQFMKQRNYLAAYDEYMRIAIGNAPWPIGVTSVGIHERSAREKISHVMNVQGTAHIMTDEATRRYLQAMKRLMTFVQRAYPTDPSRSVDFGAFKSQPMGKQVAQGMLQLEYKPKGSA